MSKLWFYIEAIRMNNKPITKNDIVELTDNKGELIEKYIPLWKFKQAYGWFQERLDDELSNLSLEQRHYVKLLIDEAFGDIRNVK